MADKPTKAVPSGRLSRLTRMGGLATRIAGSVVSNGANQLLLGQRPKLTDLILTPANITRIADQLATMRGAAMKLGQLISMDSGDILPKELSALLSKLQDDAVAMPQSQLIRVLDGAWQTGWQDKLLYFSFAPIAAASIGQVHKAITMDGTMMAVKIQYPGVSESIDSDVDNMTSLLKLSGALPSELDIKPILSEAKAQLKHEADYQREADMLGRYSTLINNNPNFVIPRVCSQWTSQMVLAMTYEKGEPLSALEQAPQAVRNRLMHALFELFFREIFDHQLLQSDPNMGNYQYRSEQEQIVLLDFGATREIPKSIAQGYQQLLQAASTQDNDKMRAAALAIGLIDTSHSAEQQGFVVNLGMTACEAIHTDGEYDFGQSDLLARLHDMGMVLTYELNFWQPPPVDALFIHRKLGGLYLLAKRLNTQVNLRAAAAPWLD